MGTIHQYPAAFAPMPAIARILAQFEREQLTGFIEVAISLLDGDDGDPDVELNGDEADGSLGEDDFVDRAGDRPGCPLSDSDACTAGDDNLEDWGFGAFDTDREDDEDDDPAGDPIKMHGEMGDGPLYNTLPIYGVDQSAGPLNEHAAHKAYIGAVLSGERL